MRISLSEQLSTRRVLLADGATGTNYFAAGLAAGEPPELWNVEQPAKVLDLHRRFIAAGADIILTNSFGCNRQRLKLHRAEGRVTELARRAAELASQAADESPRPVVVAGSIGPTGELFTPLGELTHEAAVESFAEQMQGLRAGGADVAWIETMSAPEEISAAAAAAMSIGMPYVATCSFDTAGRTMMGLLPSALGPLLAGQGTQPLAYGANCGVGAPDILVSLIGMQGATLPLVVKANCGIPRFEGAECVYDGTPDLMARYARLAIAAGARIIGGCCGTAPEHLAAMRAAIDATLAAGDAGTPAFPTIETIISEVGPLTNAVPSEREGRASRGVGAERPSRRPRH